MAYQTVNPATNQLIKEYPSHTDADIDAALKAADALYHSDWAKGDINQRLPVPVRRWVSSSNRAVAK